jgi:multicomponent Na+:H+ antiporter subunit B
VTRRARIAILLPALAVVGAVLLAGFAGIPDFGHYRGPYGDILNRVAVPERHATNVVAAIVFDYRGFDTMGEEFILFMAVVGVVLLLREQSDRSGWSDPDETRSACVRLFGVLLIGPFLIVALWLCAFGYITPGGGFQGGVMLAATALLVYLAWSHDAWHRASAEHFVDPLEGLGAGGYAVIGLVALATGLHFLTNLLGPGTAGTLLSGGSIGLLSWCSALEVLGAMALLFREFLAAHLFAGGRG